MMDVLYTTENEISPKKEKSGEREKRKEEKE